MKSRVMIIAEAGVNHNGSTTTAKKMIELAARAGADAIKFQTFKAEHLVSRFAVKADYQKITTDKKESQLEMLKKLELNEKSHKTLLAYCKRKKIQFISTPFDMESIDLLKKLGLEILKISSGDITDLPFLRKIGGLKKKLILSTGMSNLKEICNALEVLTDAGTPKEKIVILHCNSEYPTPMRDVNLRAMHTIRKKFGVSVGYSDHTMGYEVAIAAVALGATVIEKHFTLDRNLPGPDHRASLEPKELKEMIASIRNIEQALGDGNKQPSASELKNKVIGRKSIVAAKRIKKGEPFTVSNITVKRPGNGINPMKWNRVIGKKALRDYMPDELITLGGI